MKPALFALLFATFSAPAFAACEQQVTIASLAYVTKNLNDNFAGAPQIISVDEIMAGQGDLRNGFAESVVLFRDPEVTSVRDTKLAHLEVMYHSPSCTILDVSLSRTTLNNLSRPVR